MTLFKQSTVALMMLSKPISISKLVFHSFKLSGIALMSTSTRRNVIIQSATEQRILEENAMKHKLPDSKFTGFGFDSNIAFQQGAATNVTEKVASRKGSSHSSEYNRFWKAADVELARFFLGIDNPTNEQLKNINRDEIISELLYLFPEAKTISHNLNCGESDLLSLAKDEYRKLISSHNIHRPFSSAHYTGRAPYFDFMVFLKRKMEVIEANLDENIEGKEYVAQMREKMVENGLLSCTSWLNHNDMMVRLKSDLSIDEYKNICDMLNLLASHPNSYRICEFLLDYIDTSQERIVRRNVDGGDGGNAILIGDVARAIASRKKCKAIVYLKKGTGDFSVNEEMPSKYFSLFRDRRVIIEPFIVTKTLGMFDVAVSVSGGGTSSASEAIRLGLARCMVALTPEYAQTLESYNMLMQDSRTNDPKVPGQPGARKRHQWVKGG